ncbi:DUF6196 family protein [Rhizobium sp. 11515TR]|uniref:DUF6196 family protein n=1 Tax=unclassified Rhizobium TaxID=2613769 RepID=UPI000BA89937|nr:DUF6196 family protein [Rhizobium sp. 11515TR]ASW09751.1 hypothetical protein CKA34_27350 [Rhizobium sp. 11515TR]
MVDISFETSDQTDARLRRLFPRTILREFDQPYGFVEFALEEFPSKVSADALALIRNEHCWSQLVPITNGGEPFKMFSFHFPEGEDNSGFVGWLASHLKNKFGTGVFVICGQDSGRGGIYDYWGCPISLAGEISDELANLRSPGN